jgi:hypothetical protein
MRIMVPSFSINLSEISLCAEGLPMVPA